MDSGKFIIVEEMGHEIAILFDSLISHGDFLQSFHRACIVSVGFFSVKSKPSPDDPADISVGVWDKSTTLNLHSRKGIDEKLIKRVLRKKVEY